MKNSLRGFPLPESREDAIALQIQGRLLFPNCKWCRVPNISALTKGKEAWTRVQSEGLCGICQEAQWRQNAAAAEDPRDAPYEPPFNPPQANPEIPYHAPPEED